MIEVFDMLVGAGIYALGYWMGARSPETAPHEDFRDKTNEGIPTSPERQMAEFIKSSRVEEIIKAKENVSIDDVLV